MYALIVHEVQAPTWLLINTWLPGQLTVARSQQVVHDADKHPIFCSYAHACGLDISIVLPDLPANRNAAKGRSSIAAAFCGWPMVMNLHAKQQVQKFEH